MNDCNIYLECSCSSKDHIICMHLSDYADSKYPDVDLYLSMQMSPEGGFFRRLWTAIRYVFLSSPCNYGCWNETILSTDDANKVISICEDYVARRALLEEKKLDNE